MIRILCNFCERDITDHDKISVRLETGRRDVLTRKSGHWDLCISCARERSLDEFIKDEEPE